MFEFIYKALFMNPTVRGYDAGKLPYWVYEIMRRPILSVQTRIRKSQITNAAIQSAKSDKCWQIMTTFYNHINSSKFLVNIDETAVYLNF